MNWTCSLCREDIDVPDLEGMVDHLRVIHPDVGEPERWPDGGLVVHDETLAPGDFGSQR